LLLHILDSGVVDVLLKKSNLPDHGAMETLYVAELAEKLVEFILIGLMLLLI